MKNMQAILKNQFTADQVEKLSIHTALQRNWTIPHRDIVVEVLAGNVTLSGTVHTRQAFDAAETIAIRTPGVFSVSNNIVVTETNDLCRAK